MVLYQCPHCHHYHQDRHDHRHRHHDHCHHDHCHHDQCHHRHHDHCHHRHDDIDCSEEQGQGGFSAMQQNPALMQADFFLFDHLDLLMIKFLQAIHCRHLNTILAIIITNTAIFITLPLNLIEFRRFKKALQIRPP